MTPTGRPPYALEAFCGEDLQLYGTLAGDDDLTGATLVFRGWDSAGVLAWEEDVTVDPDTRGYDTVAHLPDTPDRYRFQVRQTDSGRVWVHLWGTVKVWRNEPGR